MLTIQIKLHWDRYHAHPWGQNPGRVKEAEWPPSPWRLLRSLASAWFRSHPGTSHSIELQTLIEALGNSLPLIGIGKVSFSQTVHYQPNYGKRDKATASYGTTRHENHFAATAAPICFRWNELTLDEQQKNLLTTLLEHVSYFGRADSICEATLQPEGWTEPRDFGWCKPCLSDENKPQRRINPKCRDAFCSEPASFQLTDLWQRRTSDNKAENSPIHLVNQMLATDMQVDGGCLVSYEMPKGWPQEWVVKTPRTENKPDKPAPSDGQKIARYLRFSLQCRVPIASKFTVTLAELFRAAANHHLCKVHGQGATSPALLGKDVPEGHQHAFYLPMAQEHSLTDLHVWCPMGLTRAEVDVLLRIRRLSWGNGRFPVNPVLTAMSMEPPADTQLAVGGEATHPLKSRIWRSETPFVPPLHFYRGDKANPKLRANATPEHQLVSCLRQAGLDKAVTIDRLPAFQSDRSTEPQGTMPPMPAWDIMRAPEGDDISTMPFDHAIEVATHQNSSSNHKAHQRRIGFFMRLTFNEPTALPMPSFGHSSHFGLGLFVPDYLEPSKL